MSLYTSKMIAEVEEIRRRNLEAEVDLEKLHNTEQKIGESVSGQTIVKVNTQQSMHQNALKEVPSVPNVQLVWQVKEFEINVLDLEKLRPHLTEYAIKLAINSHIKDHGPNQIDGVIYEQVVVKKCSLYIKAAAAHNFSIFC